MLAPPRPGCLSGPCGDNLIAKDHRDSLVLILHPGRGALRVGLDHGTDPLFSNLHLFQDELVGGVRVPSFLLPLLFSIPIDLVRCGLSLWLVWCLLLF
jgi:hypothetical protein